MKRALENDVARIHRMDFRTYTSDKHRTVDDTPFGGGAGMLLKPEPLFQALDDIKAQHGPIEPPRGRVVLLSPAGRRFNQRIAEEYASLDKIVLLCGHYEGFDDRVRQHLVTEELSIGDFVMTGGEIAAMAVIDAVVRLRPGVLGNQASLSDESHTDGLLEYPQFTRPATYRGHDVPKTLLSGNHKEIEKWRSRHALYRTWRMRKDLLASMELSKEQRDLLVQFEAGNFSGIDIL